jgi:hypothetical protein
LVTFFLPTIVVFGGLIILLIPDIKLKAMLCILTVGIAYFAFMVDENTGSMNYTVITELIKWFRGERVIEPVWDETFDRYHTLKIKNKTVDKEILDSYKAFLNKENESGEINETEPAVYGEKRRMNLKNRLYQLRVLMT